jgi:hypothetical protein
VTNVATIAPYADFADTSEETNIKVRFKMPIPTKIIPVIKGTFLIGLGFGANISP